jgi:hypothetical protein
MIQAIVCAFVAMSGAGMSRSGPITLSSSVVMRRVSRSTSVGESSRALTRTPPFAPP